MNRFLKYGLLFLILSSCNSALKRNYSALTVDADMREIRKEDKVSEEDISLLTRYLLLAHIQGQNIDGITYEDLLKRIKDLEERSKSVSDQINSQAVSRRERMSAFLAVSLLGKEFIKVKDTGYIIYKVEIKNKTNKGIRTIIGSVAINDLFDREIKNISFLSNESLGPYQSRTKTIRINYDYGNEGDQRVRSKKMTEVHVQWNPGKIIFDNGQLIE